MTIPLVGIGTGLALEALAPFVVQPQAPDGVQAAQRDFGADGSVYEQGLFIVLRWPVIDGAEDYQALLAQMGIHAGGGLRGAVTIYAPNFAWQWNLYSGWAIRPRTPNYRFFPQDILVTVNNLTIGS